MRYVSAPGRAPETTAGPPVKPAIEDAADVTKALAGAADAANICIALSLMVHYLDEKDSRVQSVSQAVWGLMHDMNDRNIPVSPIKHAIGTPYFYV